MSRRLTELLWFIDFWPADVIVVGLTMGSLWLARGDINKQQIIFGTIASAYGLVTTLWTVRDTLLERMRLRQFYAGHGETPDHVLEMISSANVRRESFRAAVFAVLCVICTTIILGLATATTGRVLLNCVLLLLLANSRLDRFERKRSSELLRDATKD